MKVNCEKENGNGKLRSVCIYVRVLICCCCCISCCCCCERAEEIDRGTNGHCVDSLGLRIVDGV